MFLIFSINISEDLGNNQDKILHDIQDGREKPWRQKKMNSEALAQSFYRLKKYSKYERVKNCGNFLMFHELPDKKLRLRRANFCKVRLCPMCAWRRSKKIFSQVSAVMNSGLIKNKNYRFLFLTLTVRNVKPENLEGMLKHMSASYQRFLDCRKIRGTVKGWFRALEITHNLDKLSDQYDTYHPHYHVILAVNKSYFSETKNYIKQAKWTEIWRECLRVDYNPIVNIKAFKGETDEEIEKSICEASKYTVKDKDYVIFGDEKMTDKTVKVLDEALFKKRLTAFGGAFKVVHKLLNLDDQEDGDLVHTSEEEELRKDLDYMIKIYKWDVGCQQYFSS